MKKLTFALLLAVAACGGSSKSSTTPPAATAPATGDIVDTAVGAGSFTTLVAAVQAAGLIDTLNGDGPFTVFAPTNAAFDKLPAGTVEELLKPENLSKLKKILQHHVTTSALELDFFEDGQSVGMVDGNREVFTRKGTDAFLGGAKIIASVRASNGWVHVVDAVLVPVAK